MRIIMLTWEYPPNIVGGIARHVAELSQALVQCGVEVHVVTAYHPKAREEEQERPGLFVHRVASQGAADNFIHGVQMLNAAMYSRAESLLTEWQKPTKKTPVLLHAHDWLAEFSATPLKHEFKLPLVSTIHATERGRNQGISTDIQLYINGREQELAIQSWRVIACSHYMRDEISQALGVSHDKIDVIYNGVDASKFDFPFDSEARMAYRAKFAAPDEKLVFFVGRFVREKGVHILLDAVPRIHSAFQKAKFIVVGGGWREHLVNYTRFLGEDRSVYFTGFVPDDELLKLYRVIDVAAFPSLYEPFGIVALEAMAARVPVVVSDAGGLKEIVQHDLTGTVTWLNNSDSLAWGILKVLKEPDHAAEMVAKAYDRVVSVFNWDALAKQTAAVYERVWSEFLKTEW